MPDEDWLDRLERLRDAAQDRTTRYADRFDEWSDAALDVQPALIAVARAARAHGCILLDPLDCTGHCNDGPCDCSGESRPFVADNRLVDALNALKRFDEHE